MECKLFTKPQFHDEEFHKDREVADHIHEQGHRERLLEVRDLIVDICTDAALPSLSDWGAGNGGLLSELKRVLPGLRTWGYDISPKAVRFAREEYGVDVTFLNIAEGVGEAGSIVVMTEILEHVIRPHELVKKARTTHTSWVVASSPVGETPQRHYEFHNWCWLGDSYALLFERAGWKVERHYAMASCGTQFVVARNPELTAQGNIQGITEKR